MVSLDGALRSLRDTLHSLMARVGEDFALADRVARSILKTNAILMNAPNSGAETILSELRELTEELARLGIKDKAKLNAALNQLEAFLSDL
jgi:hypothetical protein